MTDEPIEEALEQIRAGTLKQGDDEETEIVKQILKLDPKQGDVIVLQIDKHYPMEQLWDQLEKFRERAGIEIVAVTDDIEISSINARGAYVLMTASPIPAEHKKRIEDDWKERFPQSALKVVEARPEDLQEVGLHAPPESADDLDTL